MTKFYKDLCDDLFELIYYKLSEETLIEYLLSKGYKVEEDLINTLKFDREFVESVVNDLVNAYQGEGL